MKAWPGKPYPLGATWDGRGTNFALFSEHATAVELCLFDGVDSTQEAHRLPIHEQTDRVWHCYVPGVGPGQAYGYRVHGPYEPSAGHRFNPHKVLLDPYAKAIARDVRWDDSLFGYQVGAAEGDLSFDQRDNAAFAPLAEVIDPSFDWGNDRPPQHAWHNTIIYELHVKGFSRLNPAVPERLRGTYAGLACDESIRYLTELGMTAVELLPIHYFLEDRHLSERGLSNYWGYNTLGYFAPTRKYAAAPTAAEAIREFKGMVKALHAAGLEVILDVVYNHTAEGNHLGPTINFRGIDNASYYRLVPDDPRYYMDYTGCGNTLNMLCPFTLQLIMDSLRYWVLEMHVDGFRFDLASALAREFYEVDKLGAFFDIVHQDPVLNGVKLIAEPWDLGPGGYQVGNFPIGWTEWNGKYRDCIRKFWKGDGGTASEFATRISGSSDLYAHSGRRPYASINFVTCHDGFTLRDLVSYNHKHNEANGEDNRDGADHNESWNCGHEGPTDDPAINQLRARQQRNFLATLLLSQGVPMLLAGDEISHTQQGNNNTYCQDNELSWLNWQLDEQRRELLAFVRRLIELRRTQPVLHRRSFFQGRRIRGSDVKDIAWFEPSGQEMSDEAWEAGFVKCLGVRWAGDAIDELNEHGERIRGDTLLLLFNAHHEPLPFQLPAHRDDQRWQRLVDTALTEPTPDLFHGGQAYDLQGHSMAVLRIVEQG
jgi:isoamylase